MDLCLTRFHRVGSPVHAVALSADADHLLIGAEQGLRLVDRRGNVQHRLGGRAFNAVALAPKLDAGGHNLGLAMERAGRLLRLEFEQEAEAQDSALRLAAVGIWDQRDDLYSLDYAPEAGDGGLIALGHHSLGLTALDGRGRLLWRLGPTDHESGRLEVAHKRMGPASGRRTWQAAISDDGRTIYATSLGSAASQAEIVAIDAAVGKAKKTIALNGRATLLAALPEPLGVAAVVHDVGPDGARCSLLAFDAELRAMAWCLSCPPGIVVTSVAAAPPQAALVLGTNGGELWRVGAFRGRVTARYDLLFASTVLSVAVAETGEIAAGLANGYVAFLERTSEAQAGNERRELLTHEG